MENYTNIWNSLPTNFFPSQRIRRSIVTVRYNSSPLSRFPKSEIQPDLKILNPLVPPYTYWKHLCRVINPTISGLIDPKVAFSCATLRYMHALSLWNSTHKQGTLAPNFTVYFILILIPVNATSSFSQYSNIEPN